MTEILLNNSVNILENNR